MGKGSVSGGTNGLYSLTPEYKDGSSGSAVEAWCADYTTDLSGTVGTCEIPGEPQKFQVRPGYDGRATYSGTRDGILADPAAVSAAAFFYNLAMLPGWQKWKPTYRHGTITSIDYDTDTCGVGLDAETSTQQGLDVNASGSVSASIEYMECNSAAFVIGDEVLVEFTGQNLSNAKVIGFKENPVACGFREPWTGPAGNSFNPWSAYFLHYDPPVTTIEEENPWADSYASLLGSSMSLSGGEISLVRAAPGAFNSNRMWTNCDPSTPYYTVRSDLLQIKISNYVQSPSAGGPLDLWHILIQNEDEIGQDKGRYYEISSNGTFELDISTLDTRGGSTASMIGKQVRRVRIGCGLFALQGNAAGQTSFDMDYINII